MTEPKILFLDIETSPLVSYTWGIWEQNVIKTLKDSQIMCIAWKWLGQKKIHVESLDQIDLTPGTTDDKKIITRLHELFSEADIIIAHNGDQFDVKKSNTRVIKHQLQPPSPYKTIDTKKIAKRYFKFESNSLNELGRFLGVGQKMKHTGFDLWEDCIAGKPKAWKMMRKYNVQDVRLLEKVYLKLRPWIANHPNLNMYSDEPKEGARPCPVCQSQKTERRGYHQLAVRRRQKHKCLKCGHWFSGAFA